MIREPLWTKNFIFISATNFFLFISYYSLLITLPSAAITDYGTSSSVAGLFTTLYLSAAVIIRPFMGEWIDSLGKKSILLVSFILFTAISVLYGFFQSVTILLILRFLQGLGFGMATTSTGGIIADIVPDSRKGEGLGYFVMSMNLAMVIGPFIGLNIYNNFGIKILFFTVVVCSFISLLFSWLTKFPNEKCKMKDQNEKPPKFEKGAVSMGITGAFIAISYSSILSFMAVFAKNRGLEHEAGYFFAVYALFLLISRPFTGRFFDKYGPNFVVYPSIIIYAIGILTLGLSYHVWSFFLAAAFIGVGWGTLYSSLQTLAVQRSDPKRTSVATGTYLSIFDIGIGGGSFLVGLLSTYIDLGTMYVYFSGYALVGVAVYYMAQKII